MMEEESTLLKEVSPDAGAGDDQYWQNSDK